MLIVYCRLLCEGALELIYLITKDDIKTYDKFIKSSLVADKRLLNVLKAKKANNSKNIRDRIRKTICGRFMKVGYKPDEINIKKYTKLHESSIFKLAEKLGLLEIYELIYRLTSRSIHAAWYEFESYNLKFNKQKYIPNLIYHQTKPQILTSTSMLILKAVKKYIDKIYSYEKAILRSLHSSLDELITWYKKTDDLHEQFINIWKS